MDLRQLAPELAEYDRGPVHFFELPEIYWGTKIVLDDFNHTTVGWGSVNSRVFEAIAAGALANGMRTLKQDGIEKVLAGHTDISQVRAI